MIAATPRSHWRRRRERWWWLLGFCIVSLILHITIGLGTAAFHLGATPKIPAPDAGEIEISLDNPDTPAPPDTAKEKPAQRPTHPSKGGTLAGRLGHEYAGGPIRYAREESPIRATTMAPPLHARPAAHTVTPTLASNTATPNAVATEPTPTVPLFMPPGEAPTEPVVHRVSASRSRNSAAPLAANKPSNVPPAALTAVVTVPEDHNPLKVSHKLHPVLPEEAPETDTTSTTPASGPIASTTAPATAAPTGGSPTGAADANGTGGTGEGIGVGTGDRPVNRIGITRGIPFGDITGLSHTGESAGAGSTGTLGVSGGGATGQPFRLRLSRQTSSDIGGAPEHIVYVLDVSGSMSEDGKIERAREALHKAVSELLGDDMFTFITFSNTANAYSDGLKPATNFYISTMETNFDLVQPDGETNMSAAIDLALSMQGVTNIFLMSDGEPTIGITDFDELSAHIRARNVNHVHITTFALGHGEQFEGVKFLRRVAAENDGEYRYVNVRAR